MMESNIFLRPHICNKCGVIRAGNREGVKVGAPCLSLNSGASCDGYYWTQRSWTECNLREWRIKHPKVFWWEDKQYVDSPSVTAYYVQSSNIFCVAHDEQADMLYIEFVKSGTYRFEGVVAWEFEEMLKSGSIGGWFSANIKKYPGIHPYQALTMRGWENAPK